MILQQLWVHFTALFRLSYPVIIAYAISPKFTFSIFGMVTMSSIIALGVFYRQYTASKREASHLVYVPSEEILTKLNQEIATCKMDGRAVSFGYAHLFDKVALSIFNTIKIDPLLWKECDEDEVKIRITDVINTHILPTVTQDKKTFIDQISRAFTAQAQTFILRHELGHVADNASLKRLISIGSIIFLTILSGMTVAALLTSTIGIVAAFIMSLCVEIITDLTLSALNNHLLKAAQEKNADLFAAHYSSPEEIRAAAKFFQAYDKAAKEIIKPQNIFELIGLPSTFARGYYSGDERAAYLLKATEQHQKS